MVEIDLVEYEPDHIDEIMKNPRKWELKLSQNQDWTLWKQAWKKMGPAFTVLANGKPIGSGGMLIMENNVGEVWMVWSEMMRDYTRCVYPIIKRMLNVTISSFRLDGVQAFIDPEFDGAKRMIKHLGFIEDAPMTVCGMPMIRFWRAY